MVNKEHDRNNFLFSVMSTGIQKWKNQSYVCRFSKTIYTSALDVIVTTNVGRPVNSLYLGSGLPLINVFL